MIYLDNNATAPLHPAARQAWLEAADQFVGNPSSPHRIGARAEAALARAREELAAHLGCDPFDLVWTSGATEASNSVFHHLSRIASPDAEVWISAVEHPCVLEAARYWFSKCRFIPVNANGQVKIDWLEAQLQKQRPALVAVMAANNETGVLQPWKQVHELCRRFGVLYFCDAVQWVGKLPGVGLGEIDFVSGSAHKFGGPKGVGFLKCNDGRFHPLLRGGLQEEGRRAGTENVPGILAMVAALRAREPFAAGSVLLDRLEWRAAVERELVRQIPGTEIVAEQAERLWNTICALMPQTECQGRWVVKLDRHGVAVSTGSACASGKEEPSHVLRAMGMTAEQAGRAIRFSSSWETTREEWEGALAAAARVQSSLAGITSG